LAMIKTYDVAGGLKGDKKKYSHINLDMAFVHIPVPEFRGVCRMIGNRNETEKRLDEQMVVDAVKVVVPKLAEGGDGKATVR
jgi:hypothetical protein